ncbi:unnamed protein product [Clonostachys byssicola]|uniref:Thymidylate kinase n=1 Tax=Clonostachys byssicola TaxID=160290 RepID=A0A9N9XXQ2_9HYPO|nr:unnamed protein product [Clonostachys byssicola]
MAAINELLTTSEEDPATHRRGAFVVLEGLDRSGKTTQVKLMEQRFVELGKPVKTVRFPDRTTLIGQMIDGYLRSNVEMDDHAIHLLFSANRWEAASNIKALLARGVNVISDRYFHSGVVYSAAKGNPALGMEWARAPEVGLPRPDMVVFLDLTPEEAEKRGGWGEEKYEKGAMQRRVRELFRELGERELGDGSREREVVVLDAGDSVEGVAEAIWDTIRGRVEEVERGERGELKTVV